MVFPNSLVERPEGAQIILGKLSSPSTSEMSKATKHYLLKGQINKPEAEKLKWSSTFLEQVDIEKVYEDYLASGGAAGNIEAFAKFLTDHAPINPNWQELIKNFVFKDYGYEITRFEPLSKTEYQAYVKIDGREVPYVVVNARTGYYHG